MRDGYTTSPINQLPWVVWLLAVPVVALEVAAMAGGTGFLGVDARAWRSDLIQALAFSPKIFAWMAETGDWQIRHLARFVTYPFAHGSPVQALFGVVFVLALGKFVAEVFRAWAVLAVFFAAAIVGALAYSALPGAAAGLIGAYPAVYGLIGAFTYIHWARLGAANENRARAFTLIGFLLGIQLVFGLLFGGGLDWVAELAGFVAGFALSFFVSPGGVQRAIAQMRQR